MSQNFKILFQTRGIIFLHGVNSVIHSQIKVVFLAKKVTDNGTRDTLS